MHGWWLKCRYRSVHKSNVTGIRLSIRSLNAIGGNATAGALCVSTTTPAPCLFLSFLNSLFYLSLSFISALCALLYTHILPFSLSILSPFHLDHPRLLSQYLERSVPRLFQWFKLVTKPNSTRMAKRAALWKVYDDHLEEQSALTRKTKTSSPLQTIYHSWTFVDPERHLPSCLTKLKTWWNN